MVMEGGMGNRPSMAKQTGDVNKKQSGIGAESELPKAKIEAVEVNKKQWGIGVKTEPPVKTPTSAPKIFYSTDPLTFDSGSGHWPAPQDVRQAQAAAKTTVRTPPTAAAAAAPAAAAPASAPTAVSLSLPPLPKAKLEAVEVNKKQWGIGAESDVPSSSAELEPRAFLVKLMSTAHRRQTRPRFSNARVSCAARVRATALTLPSSNRCSRRLIAWLITRGP